MVSHTLFVSSFPKVTHVNFGEYILAISTVCSADAVKLLYGGTLVAILFKLPLKHFFLFHSCVVQVFPILTACNVSVGKYAVLESFLTIFTYYPPRKQGQMQ